MYQEAILHDGLALPLFPDETALETEVVTTVEFDVTQQLPQWLALRAPWACPWMKPQVSMEWGAPRGLTTPLRAAAAM